MDIRPNSQRSNARETAREGLEEVGLFAGLVGDDRPARAGKEGADHSQAQAVMRTRGGAEKEARPLIGCGGLGMKLVEQL